MESGSGIVHHDGDPIPVPPPSPSSELSASRSILLLVVPLLLDYSDRHAPHRLRWDSERGSKFLRRSQRSGLGGARKYEERVADSEKEMRRTMSA